MALKSLFVNGPIQCAQRTEYHARMLWAVALVVLSSTSQPDWTASEMKTLLSQAQAAGRAPTLDAQNRVLLAVAAAAYRASTPALASGRADVQTEAKRVLRKRAPNHPNVKQGQWLSALMRQFYEDASARCRVLGRFARERRDRVFFEQMTQQARLAADELARGLQLQVEGLDGYSTPLPVVDGDPPYPHASKAIVSTKGGIDVDGMERVRFIGHRPPAEIERTENGAIRKLFSAFQFFERSAQSLGPYDSSWAKKRGHVRVVVPARFPAAYLNEVARAAREAKMRRMHVMVMTQRGELRELRVDLNPRRRAKKKKRKVKVTCTDDITMSRCAERIAYARKKGQPVWASR